MILTKKEILERNLFETPLLEEQIKMTAIDLLLDDDYSIAPNEYIHTRCADIVHLDNKTVATLYPRSSSNRRGLSIDMTGLIDCGYRGTLVIPVRNNTQFNIMLKKGERIASLVFEDVISPVEIELSQWHQNKV